MPSPLPRPAYRTFLPLHLHIMRTRREKLIKLRARRAGLYAPAIVGTVPAATVARLS